MKPRNNFFFAFSLLLALSLLQSCGGTGAGNPESSEDGSVSGTAAGAVGGALSNSTSSGTLAYNEGVRSPQTSLWKKPVLDFFTNAYASSVCPTYRSSQAAGCASSGGTLWLNYADCSFAGSSANWNGTQALISSSGSASCGTFPSPGANGNLSRQYVASSGSTAAGSVTITNAYGTQTTIDDGTANVGNFDGDTISTFIDAGYGAKVSYTSGQRSSIQLAHHLYTSSFDHSVSGTVTISDTGVGSQTINGSITVYHNLLRVVGTAKFQNVSHQDTCCFPTSGSIVTTFTAGSNSAQHPPTAAGNAYIQGGSETLNFTGCGTATLQAYDGSTASVSLTRCF